MCFQRSRCHVWMPKHNTRQYHCPVFSVPLVHCIHAGQFARSLHSHKIQVPVRDTVVKSLMYNRLNVGGHQFHAVNRFHSLRQTPTRYKSCVDVLVRTLRPSNRCWLCGDHRPLRLLEGLLAPGCAKKALGHFHTFFRWKVEAATDRKRKSSPVNASFMHRSTKIPLALSRAS